MLQFNQRTVSRKSAKRIKYKEDVATKAEHFQEELEAATVQTKRKIGAIQQNYHRN